MTTSTPLRNAVKHLIADWYLREIGKQRRPGAVDPAHGAYAELERRITASPAGASKPGWISDTLSKGIEAAGKKVTSEPARRAWPVILQVVEHCALEQDQARYTQQLAWLWRSSEGGGEERPPGYIGELLAPDGQRLPALTDARQAKAHRDDLKVPLLQQEIAQRRAQVGRLQHRLDDLHEQVRRADRSRQARGLRHHHEVACLREHVQDLRQQLTGAHDALHQLHAGRAQETAERESRHRADREAAESTARGQQQLLRQLEHLLDAQATQARQLEQLAQRVERTTRERDAAYQVAGDQTAHRRRLEAHLAERDNEIERLQHDLAATRAHADQLAAQVAADGTELARLNAVLPPSDLPFTGSGWVPSSAPISPTPSPVAVGRAAVPRFARLPTETVVMRPTAEPIPQPTTDLPQEPADPDPPACQAARARPVSRAYASNSWLGRSRRGIHYLWSHPHPEDRWLEQQFGMRRHYEKFIAEACNDQERIDWAQRHAEYCAQVPRRRLF